MKTEILNNDCAVYCIEHIATGAKYIGATRDVKRRKQRHFYDMSRGIHVNSKMQSVFDASPSGNSAFSFSVIEYCAPEQLDYAEERVIDTVAPTLNGHTHSTGHRLHDEDTRKRLSERQTGEKHHTFEGYYLVPWGRFSATHLAAKASNGLVSNVTIGKIMKNLDKPISRLSFTNNRYLMQHHDESVIGKTWRSIGFSFEAKAEAEAN